MRTPIVIAAALAFGLGLPAALAAQDSPPAGTPSAVDTPSPEMPADGQTVRDRDRERARIHQAEPGLGDGTATRTRDRERIRIGEVSGNGEQNAVRGANARRGGARALGGGMRRPGSAGARTPRSGARARSGPRQ